LRNNKARSGRKKTNPHITLPQSQLDWWAYYKSHGFNYLLPLKKDKSPTVRRWDPLYDNPASDALIKEWKRYRYTRIGIITGKKNDLSVFDADSEEALKELMDVLPGKQFNGPIVKTPSGNYHFYCRYSKEIGRTKMHKGVSGDIDVKNSKGYVGSPPMYAEYTKKHPVTKEDIEYKGTYEWINSLDDFPIPQVPGVWIKLIGETSEREEKPLTLPQDSSKYEGVIPKGERHPTLLKQANAWAREGLTYEEVLRLLTVMNNKLCEERKEQKEIEKIARDACNHVANSVESDVPMSHWASEVERKEIIWLWKNYIPCGVVTMYGGDPDAGKSWWTLNLCCKVSQGARWPDTTPGEQPANSFFMTYEDDASSVLKNRIEQLGGDQNRIALYNTAHPIHTELSKPEGLVRLERELIRLGNVKLVVIDPIADFTGKTNPNAVQEVRAILTPMAEMAKRLKLALVLIAHMNKDQQKAAMYRIGGSVGGWIGKSRASFIIAKDKVNWRHVFPFKHNYSWPDPIKFKFKITPEGLDIHSSQADIEEVLCPQRGRPIAASTNIAREFIANMFNERTIILDSEVKAACSERGISKYAVRKVRVEEGYSTEWDSERGGYVWKKS